MLVKILVDAKNLYCVQCGTAMHDVSEPGEFIAFCDECNQYIDVEIGVERGYVVWHKARSWQSQDFWLKWLRKLASERRIVTDLPREKTKAGVIALYMRENSEDGALTAEQIAKNVRRLMAEAGRKDCELSTGYVLRVMDSLIQQKVVKVSGRKHCYAPYKFQRDFSDIPF